VTVGGSDCRKPYSASILNVSAMSYGALSKNAVLALNGGAKDGGFAHNTGEGSMSPYHLGPGGDLIWQIGTGYFGCRDGEGRFDPAKFAEKAQLDQVKMIEIKISQGAKPGHGGILPKEKITAEIAAIRDVPLGCDVVSPPSHSAFSTPIELLQFVRKLRELSGGKPVGFKLCVGIHRGFFAVCKAMLATGIKPDFITVDGGEGGTGAAPMEFSNHIGEPSIDGLIFVHNALTGFDLRDEIRLISSGKITTGFGLVKRLAIGADLCNSAALSRGHPYRDRRKQDLSRSVRLRAAGGILAWRDSRRVQGGTGERHAGLVRLLEETRAKDSQCSASGNVQGLGSLELRGLGSSLPTPAGTR